MNIQYPTTDIRRIILILLILLFSIAGVELLLRIFYPVIQEVNITYKGDEIGQGRFILSNDPELLYEWKVLPQAFTEKKKEGVFRIFFLGDSVIFRNELSLEDFPPKILENLLNAHFGSMKYEVINVGVPGYNTKQEARMLEQRLLTHSPDMVIVGYCAPNDRVIKRHIRRYKDGLYCSDVKESIPYVRGFPYRLAEYLVRNSYVYRFVNLVFISMVNMIDKDLLRDKVSYFDYSVETDEAIKRMRILAQRNRFELLFVISPDLLGKDQYESDWAASKFEQYSIKHIDLRGPFSTAGYERIRISDNDWIHPNKIGNRLMAQEIFSYLKNIDLAKQ